MLTTPIDAHLPLVIALLLLWAWLARGTRWAAAVQCAVPLLIGVMMLIPEERARLLAFGIIVAAAFAATAAATECKRAADILPADLILTVSGIVILRWIPLHDVHVLKELVVLGGSIALLFAIPRRSGSMVVSIIAVLAVAVVTPLPPGRMALFPLAVAVLAIATRRVPQLAVGAVLLVCACFARYSLATVYVAAAIVFLVPLLERVRPLAIAAALLVFALWPWSGIIARALPVVRNYEAAARDSVAVGSAMAPAESLSIAVPPHVRHVVVTASAGQAARLRPGRAVGTIEATDGHGRTTARVIRIGDVADFGFTRREQFFGSRNSLPRFPSGEIRDFGANAWVWGGGRIAVASAGDITALRVVASPDLPRQAHLQIDSVEFPAR